MADVETAQIAYWQEITTTNKALGKCLLLTRYGVAVIGNYHGEEGYVAFSPLPKIPVEIKEKIYGQRKECSAMGA